MEKGGVVEERPAGPSGRATHQAAGPGMETPGLHREVPGGLRWPSSHPGQSVWAQAGVSSLSCPSQALLSALSQGAPASLPWTPKAPQLHNSSISLPPPFSPLPSSPATVHLLIHEALISSLFNFVLNRLTGMITTCSAVLASPTTPVF